MKNFIEAISLLLLRLEIFQPELLFICAGIDAHVDDVYHFLTEADCHWITKELCQNVEKSFGIYSHIWESEGEYSLTSSSSINFSFSPNASNNNNWYWDNK